MTHLEHVNLSVSDAHATAAMLQDLFGWHIRWEGPAKDGGISLHVGSENDYIAVYTPKTSTITAESSDLRHAGLNHIGVVVDDLAAVEAKVIARGLTPSNHGDYEPGQRFYFNDPDGLEFEVVSYS